VTEHQTLEVVITSSPARIMPGRWYVVRVTDGVLTLGEHDLALSRDATEVTLVTSDEERVEAARRRGTPPVGPFALLRFEIIVPFQAPGFIAAAATANADAGVNIYVISTFSYDYVLVADDDVSTATAALRRRGFPVLEP
jgi:hypothetical protein